MIWCEHLSFFSEKKNNCFLIFFFFTGCRQYIERTDDQ